MLEIDFLKCHASGSDFTIIDIGTLSHDSISDIVKREIAINICNRKGVIGADGCIFIDSTDGRATVEIYTPNGERIPLCINGVRCASRFLIERQVDNCLKVELTLPVGILKAQKAELEEKTLWGVCIDGIHGVRCLDRSEEELEYVEQFRRVIKQVEKTKYTENMRINGVWLGAPYLLCYVDTIDEKFLEMLAIKFNLNRVSSDAANVAFIKILTKEAIYVSTFERNGIGISPSCGAAGLSAIFLGSVNGTHDFGSYTKVYSSGGVLFGMWEKMEEDFYATLKADCSYVYRGKTTYNIQSRELGKVLQGELYIDEISSYGTFRDAQTVRIGEDDFVVNRAEW